MNKTQPTPRPWKNDGKAIYIDGTFICWTPPNVADGTLIVQAVNAHDELLANAQANSTIVSNAELEAMSKDSLVNLLNRIRNEALNTLKLVGA
jgi:hypothetical protein